MSVLDLKLMLLKSLSSVEPMHRHHCVRLGHSQYLISYIVKGKYLMLEQIKQMDPRRAERRRIGRRKRMIQRLFSTQCDSSVMTASLASLVISEDLKPHKSSRSVQACITTANVECNTEPQAPLSPPPPPQVQQIAPQENKVRKPQRKQSTQTSNDQGTQGVQTELVVNNCGVQTDSPNCYERAMQTRGPRQENTGMQTDDTPPPPLTDAGRSDREAMIFMLNEIGEMILNQNHVLHNNTTILSKFTEMSMMRRTVVMQGSYHHYWRQHRYGGLGRRGDYRRTKRSSSSIDSSDQLSMHDAEQQTQDETSLYVDASQQTEVQEQSVKSTQTHKKDRRNAGGGADFCRCC